jgi:hypothetical protein
MIKIKPLYDQEEQSLDAPEVPQEPLPIKVKLLEPEEKTKITINKPEPAKVVLPVNVKKTLDGNILIKDHPLIDIMIVPASNKIVTMPKDNKYRDTYGAQKELYDLLRKFGLITYDSVQGGTLYGALEAKYPENDKVDSLSALLVGIYKLLQQHQQYSKIETDYEETFEDSLTEPGEGEYTDYETAMSTHRVRKGSIDPKQKAFGLLFRI